MLVEMGEQTRFLDFYWENTKKWQFSKEGGGGRGRGGKPPLNETMVQSKEVRKAGKLSFSFLML